MSELRWILLAAGVALIAGIYAWGTLSRRRSGAAAPVRPLVHEPQPLEQESPARIEPQVRLEEAVPAVHEVVPAIELGAAVEASTAASAGRREPTLGERLTAPTAERATPPLIEPASAPAAEPEDESEDAVAARAQRIVALRVTAPAPSRFEGSLLHEAVLAEGFEFGRYDIFHRLDPVGRPVVSLASLREPGTFDPATMAGAAYAGVALFAVLPGPLPAQQSFEELLAVARSLAGRLGGHVQDERGAPLGVQRIARLREEMLAFDRERVVARAAR